MCMKFLEEIPHFDHCLMAKINFIYIVVQEFGLVESYLDSYPNGVLSPLGLIGFPTHD